MSQLRDDLLPTLESIADYTGEPVRRLRHLIAVHHFPVKRIGARLTSRRSWVDRYYDVEPDAPGNGGES